MLEAIYILFLLSFIISLSSSLPSTPLLRPPHVHYHLHLLLFLSAFLANDYRLPLHILSLRWRTESVSVRAPGRGLPAELLNLGLIGACDCDDCY